MYDLQDKHIGSFEFGIAFEGILDNLKNAYHIEFAVFIEEASLHEFANGVSPGIYSEQNRVGKFIRFHSTNNAVFQSLVLDKDLNTTENTQYDREVLGVPYGAVLVPLRNGAGEVLGVVVAASDFSATRASKGRSIIWQSSGCAVRNSPSRRRHTHHHSRRTAAPAGIDHCLLRQALDRRSKLSDSRSGVAVR